MGHARGVPLNILKSADLSISKGIIISLDLILALPIALLSMYLFFIAFRQTSVYMVNMSVSKTSYLKLFGISQDISYMIENEHMNYNKTLYVGEGIAKTDEAQLSLMRHYDIICRINEICRIVEINGISYVMVVEYENTS
jgi:hypothetical protein